MRDERGLARNSRSVRLVEVNIWRSDAVHWAPPPVAQDASFCELDRFSSCPPGHPRSSFSTSDLHANISGVEYFWPEHFLSISKHFQLKYLSNWVSICSLKGVLLPEIARSHCRTRQQCVRLISCACTKRIYCRRPLEGLGSWNSNQSYESTRALADSTIIIVSIVLFLSDERTIPAFSEAFLCVLTLRTSKVLLRL